MPTIFEARDLRVTRASRLQITALATPAMLGTRALQVERIDLEPDATTPSFGAVDAERFVYVIRGAGQARVGDQTLPLEAESVLWLERQDIFSLQAGTGGLEVLVCRAPGDE